MVGYKKTRVMHVLIGNGFGGLERVVFDLIQQGDKERFSFYLLCMSEPTVLKKEFNKLGVPIISLGFGRGKNLFLPLALRRAVRKHHIDILHFHDFKPFLNSVLATLAMPRVIKIFTEHSGVFSLEKRHLIVLKILSSIPNHLVMVSKQLKQFYQDKLGLSSDKIIVIHNGIDITSFSRAQKIPHDYQSLGIKKGIVVGTAVRLIEQKGLSHFVEAAQIVLREEQDVRFVLVGDGRLKEKLIVQTQKLGVAPNFHFLGYRKDIPELLSMFDIYVLPSLWEGLPLCLIEAMTAGKAIVSTAVGGVPELIEHGKNGLLVPPGDSSALACSILNLIRDQKGRECLGENAAKMAMNSFSRERMVRQYESLYIKGFCLK